MNMELKDELLVAALHYADLGLSIIPLGLDSEKKHHKRPLVKWTPYQKTPPTKEEITEWFQKFDVKGIAMIVEGTDFVVIDIEKEGLANIQDLHLPPTINSRTGGGGRHFIFRCTDVFSDKIRFRPFMDARREGLIILPPSLHYSGNKYEWEIPFGSCEIADLPTDLLKELMTSQKSSEAPQLNFAEGSRDNTLTSLAGYLRHKGLNQETIYTALQAVNIKECKPPLSDKDVAKIAKSISSYEVGTPNGLRSPIVVCLEDVQPEDVKWLWTSRIPYGKLTIIEGDPGTGKSSISMDIAAKVTLGKAMYGDDEFIERKPAKVLLLAAEDGLADTIRPRLDSMGADVKLVESLIAVKDEKGNEQHFSLEKDLSLADEVLSKGGYGLVIIDPLNAYMGSVDTYKDSSVRTVLTPLKALAEKHGVALICIRHLTKATGGRALYRGQGSIGFAGAARFMHLVGVNPEDFSQRVMSCTKSNITALPPSLAFTIDGKSVSWNGVVDLSADALLSPALDTESKSALDEAKEFLTDLLSEGSKSQKEVMKEAKNNGIAEKTLRRAKEILKVKSQRINNEWRWKMANDSDWTSCPPSLLEPLEGDEPKMAKEEDKENLATLPEEVQPFKRVEWQ